MVINEAMYQLFIKVTKPDPLPLGPVSKMCGASVISLDCSGGITTLGKVFTIGIRIVIE